MEHNQRSIYVAGDYIAEQHIGTQILHAEHVYNTPPQTTSRPKSVNIEDVPEVNTSFFCTERYAADIIEKNIREAIDKASSKADACRRIMQLDTCDYIRLSNVPDAEKARLINQFSEPTYTFTGDDFKKARNNPVKQKQA